MGIRKHFERKPPDEDLKLQDLSLKKEQEKPELPFDPETEITDTDWQGMLDQLEEYRKKNEWWKFANQAMCMKILAAEKVEITDQGLKLTMPGEQESFKQEKRPHPERRNF